MRRARLLPLIGSLALGAVASAPVHAAARAQIVFASDRDKNDPGELYAVTRAGVVRDVSRSPAEDHAVAGAVGRDLIAFWSSRSGADRLYLARRDGSRLRLVHGVPASAGGRAERDVTRFSGDGSRLVVSAVQGEPGRARTYAVDTRAAKGRPLRRCGTLLGPSPDGSLVACRRRGADVVDVIGVDGRARFAIPGTTALWSARGRLAVAGPHTTYSGVTGTTTVVGRDGARVARVPGFPLAWSPNGRQLVLASQMHTLVATAAGSLRSQHQLLAVYDGPAISFVGSRAVLVEIGGGGLEVEVPLAGGPWRLGPSPSLQGLARSASGRIAYPDYGAAQTARNGLIPIVVTDAGGGHQHVVARFPYHGEDGTGPDLTWAGDRLLVHTRMLCGGGDLYAAPATGGVARRLTRSTDDLEAPAAAADGRIAYDAGMPCGRSTPVHIETVRADGSRPRRITDDGDGTDVSFDGAPAWSPDGRHLVFVHRTMRSARIVSVPSTGGPRTGLATLDAYGDPGSTRPTNGVRLAYVDDGIWTLPVAGGAPRRIAPAPATSGGRRCGSGGPIAWSPDGSQIAMAAAGGIWTLRLAGAARWRLAIRVPCAGQPAWSPDGRQIAFDAPPAGRASLETDILVADADGSHLHTVSAAPFRDSLHPTWLPAG